MDQPTYRMDRVRRDAVFKAIQEVCGYRSLTVAAGLSRLTGEEAKAES